MFNATEIFAASMQAVTFDAFNTTNMPHKINDKETLLTACVYAVFSDTVAESSMTRREKQAIYDEINPTIEGATCADDRKTIPVIRDAYLYLTTQQVDAIKSNIPTNI